MVKNIKLSKKYSILNSKENMENNMIPKNTYHAILALKLKGHSIAKIANLLGCGRRTIYRHLQKENWGQYGRKSEKSILNQYKEFLINRMPEVHYNASILYRELLYQGFIGSYEIVKKYISSYRPEIIKAYQRFETKPGEQSQFDWGASKVHISNKVVPIKFGSLVLCYSRYLFAKAYSNERLASVINVHESAFKYFGGMTDEILYDNARTMVSEHNTNHNK